MASVEPRISLSLRDASETIWNWFAPSTCCRADVTDFTLVRNAVLKMSPCSASSTRLTTFEPPNACLYCSWTWI
ncbi:hypothetical protein D3C72_1498740 [compost metagenome]